MLDNLDLDISLDKETYDAKIEPLMQQLRSLQQACWEKKTAHHHCPRRLGGCGQRCFG